MPRRGDWLAKPAVYTAAAVVLGLCVYVFFLGTELTQGKFKADPLAIYFLAKGIFCSMSLILSYAVLEAIRNLRE
jgi:hypothetical protein